MAQLYLKFEGAGAGSDLEGKVQRDNYKSQIKIGSVQIGASHGGGRPSPDHKGASVPGNSAPGMVSMSKTAGPESPGLLAACLKGTCIDKAIITMDGSSEEKTAKPIYTIELEMVLVRDIGLQGDAYGGEDNMSENLSLDYDKITFTHSDSKKMMNYSAAKVASV